MNAEIKPRLIAIICVLLALTAAIYGQQKSSYTSTVKKYETRCGWFRNPTPANIWLVDRDGEWIIGVQGGYHVEGEWDWPIFKPHQWVVTNSGSYGYGCACFRLRVDRKTYRVLEIKSVRALPLETCRKDRNLKKLESSE